MIRYVLNAIAVIVAFILASQLTGPLLDLLGFWEAFTPERPRAAGLLAALLRLRDRRLLRDPRLLPPHPPADREAARRARRRDLRPHLRRAADHASSSSCSTASSLTGGETGGLGGGLLRRAQRLPDRDRSSASRSSRPLASCIAHSCRTRSPASSPMTVAAPAPRPTDHRRARGSTGPPSALARDLLGAASSMTRRTGRLAAASSRSRPTLGRRTSPPTRPAAAPRATRVMFGPPGHLYVYLVYGLHHCLNVVAGPGTSPRPSSSAPLALDEGVDLARAPSRRPRRRSTAWRPARATWAARSASIER